MMKIKFMAVMALCSYAAFATTRISLNENERIKADVGADAMNRISCSGARIVKVICETGVMEYTQDEVSGSLFVRPLSEGVIPATVIMDGGTAQDITFHAKGTSPRTVVLEAGASKADTQKEISPQSADGFTSAILGAIKALSSGTLPDIPHIRASRQVKGFSVSCVSGHRIGGYTCYVFEVKNCTGTDVELYERKFSIFTDKALSFECSFLKPDEKTRLYVVGA